MAGILHAFKRDSEDTEEFDTVSGQETLDDLPPSRNQKRTYTPREGTANAGSTGTKRRGRTPGITRLRQQISALVGGFNLVLNYVAPDDVLDNEEMTLLSTALAEEAAQSARIKTWMARASGPAAHAALIAAIITILLPRLQRRGYIPSFEAKNDANLDAAVPMETRRTYDDNGRYGQRQDNPSGEIDSSANVYNFI